MASENEQNIASRVVQGSLISGMSSAVTIVLGFIRTILLTAFLLPDDVGVVAQALIFVGLSAQIRMPGIHRAFIQRQDSSQNLFKTYFTLHMSFTLLSIAIMIAFTPVIAQFYPAMPLLSLILVALLPIEIIKGFNESQITILKRNLSFDTVGKANVASSISATIVAPLMAWYGFGPWSLVGEMVAAHLARTAVLLFSSTSLRIQLGIDRQIARSFWQFGVKVWTAQTFSFATDRFDDFWVGLSLGQASLGLYSRAYEFARYSRNVVGIPIVSVFYSTFARLQSDRLTLSKAFFRAMSLLVRVGFLFSLLFILPAPEFIQLIGKQWLPMLPAFQLMVVYVMVEPLWMLVERLLTAVGHPELNARTKGIQLVVFIPSVIFFSWWLGIVGAALATDIMTLIGFVILFSYTGRFVDYSLRALFLWPGVALVVTAVITLLLTPTWQQMNPWLALPAKLLLITSIYGTIIWLTEREQLKTAWQIVWKLIQPSLERFRRKPRGEKTTHHTKENQHFVEEEE